jgi:hypothetical protein
MPPAQFMLAEPPEEGLSDLELAALAGVGLLGVGGLGYAVYKVVTRNQTASTSTASPSSAEAALAALGSASGSGGTSLATRAATAAAPGLWEQIKSAIGLGSESSSTSSFGPAVTAMTGTLPSSTLTGSQFIESVRSLSGDQRKPRVVEAALAGQIPNRSRPAYPIQVEANGHTGTFFVAPDVLAIGTDGDFVRMPLGAREAQRVADALGYSLLTKKMSDLTWQNATVRLDPQSQSGGDSFDAVLRSHQAIEAERAGREGLTGGINKDMILSREIADHPGKVVIYGWHRTDGRPIQGGPPFNTQHSAGYTDYSQAPRFALGIMIVDGQQMRVEDVLMDPNLNWLISDEGRIAQPRYAT